MSLPDPSTTPGELSLPTTPGQPLAIHLLGGLRLSGIGGTKHGYETRHHVRALLAMVGSSVGGVERDEMVELLWPSSSAQHGRNRLYHTVHLARQTLTTLAWDDEWVTVRNSRVLLDERVWCDARVLERAVRGESATLDDGDLAELLPLCREDWMPDLEIGPVGESMRAQVRKSQATLLRRVIEQERALGDTHALRALLQNFLRIETTDEWAHRELMRLDLAAGRRYAVLRTFESLSRQLSTQLGLRPSAETISLFASANDELQKTPSAAFLGLRKRAPSLVGREGIIHDLVEQMIAGAGAWNLTGMSGIGKTTIALEVAHRSANKMPDGTCVVSLGDLGASECAISACVRALGLAATQQRDEADSLVRTLQARHMLLILDDLDAANDAQTLLALLPLGDMRARVIVTTRAPTGLNEMKTVAIEPLQSPARGATRDQAMQSAAFALFQIRCPAANDERESPAWQRDAVQLVRRLEGLPLAIELAAARTATMTPSEILRQIKLTLRPLGDGPTDMEGRHGSLQASLDWSVSLLSSTARSGYGALAVFPGSFECSDVSSLMPAVGLLPNAVDDVLDELVATGLVAPVTDGGRVRMLHLPRAHARCQAMQLGQWIPIVSARLVEVCRRLDEAPLVYESSNYTVNLQRVLTLQDDAVALLEHALALDPRRFVRILATLCESWVGTGSVGAISRWAEAGIACAHELHMANEECCLRTALTCSMRTRLGNASAEEFSRSLLPLMHRVTEPMLVARAVEERAISMAQSGQALAAAALLRQTMESMQLDSASDGYWTLCTRLFLLGFAPADVTLDLESLRARFAGSDLWINILRAAHGDTRRGVDWTVSLGLSEEMVVCARSVHSPIWTLTGIWSRGVSQFGLDQTAQGLCSFEEGYQFARRAGLEEFATDSRIFMATWCRYLLDLDGADRFLNEAAGMVKPSDRDAFVVMLPLQRAAVLALRGNAAAASQAILVVPRERLFRVRDVELGRWAEVGALIARSLGYSELMTDLAGALRQFDAQHDIIPAIRRFRDQHFGPGAEVRPPSPSEGALLRDRLRVLLQELQQRLTDTNGEG